MPRPAADCIHTSGAGLRTPVVVALVGAALFAALVVASRVYLGVHWATDVLAGWLLAACWAGSAMIIVVLLRRRKAGASATVERHRT